MSFFRWPALIALVACVVVPTRSASAQTQERVIYASVVDRNGAPVKDLTARDFIVREDSFAREVLRATRATDPIQVAVLIDNSQAAESHLNNLRRAVTAFVKAMHENNAIALITLADRPTILVEYTRNLDSLEKGAGSIFAQSGSGARLIDGIAEVSIGLRKRDAPRSVILVIAMEGPEMSDRLHDDVLNQLRESGAALHVLLLTSGGGALLDDPGRERELVIARGTHDTGGRREDLVSSNGLEAKLQQVAAELSNQYRVVYAHPETLIPPESTEVSVRRPGLSARGIPMKAPRTR